jgi:transcriptional regulator with GAF, ATPase, and Fis domain
VLPPSLQGKLLRLLEDGSYRRLGGTQELVSEARIVSSSNADLAALVAKGNFRADLYYRLNVIELHIPPLRARCEDIIPLAEHYLAQFARGAGHRVPSLTSAARAALRDHGWPGNVRELRNRLERALGLVRRRYRLRRSSRNRCCSISRESRSQPLPKRASALNVGTSRKRYPRPMAKSRKRPPCLASLARPLGKDAKVGSLAKPARITRTSQVSLPGAKQRITVSLPTRVHQTTAWPVGFGLPSGSRSAVTGTGRQVPLIQTS